MGSVVFQGHTSNLKLSLEVWLGTGIPFLPVLSGDLDCFYCLRFV